MRCFLLLQLLDLLLVLPKLVFKLLDALALLRGQLGRDATFWTLSDLLEYCRVLHALKEGTLVHSAQIRWHHVEVLKLGHHRGIDADGVNDLRATADVNWRVARTSVSL